MWLGFGVSTVAIAKMAHYLRWTLVGVFGFSDILVGMTSFKFRTIDLLAITTWVAAVAAAFQADLMLFRQLLGLSLVLIFSFVAVLLRPKMTKARFLGLLGGGLAAICYLVLVYFLEAWIDFSDPRIISIIRIPIVFKDALPAVVFSISYGAILGPLLAFYFRVQPLPAELQKSYWISVVMLGGVLLILFFAMLDRLSFHSRDWNLFVVGLSLVFVMQGWAWIGRFENSQNSAADEVVAENGAVKEAAT